MVLQDLTYALQSMQVLRRMPSDEPGRGEETERQIEALKRAVGGLRDAIYELRLESAQEQPLVRTLASIVELNRQIGPGARVRAGRRRGVPGVDSRGRRVSRSRASSRRRWPTSGATRGLAAPG